MRALPNIVVAAALSQKRDTGLQKKHNFKNRQKNVCLSFDLPVMKFLFRSVKFDIWVSQVKLHGREGQSFFAGKRFLTIFAYVQEYVL